MNLAYKYPIVYWNTANLIVDSGALEEKGTTNYEKIARAIGGMKKHGISVVPPNINTSDSIFIPDTKNDRILYGLSALTSVNAESIQLIKNNRPYQSFKDFLIRCGSYLKKPTIINLIKSGAFDEMEEQLLDRRSIMAYYLSSICPKKKSMTLQQLNGLLEKKLIPMDKFEFEVRIYNFTKWLRQRKKDDYYIIDEDAGIEFYNRFLAEDEAIDLSSYEGEPAFVQKEWDKYYLLVMDDLKQWMKDNKDRLIEEAHFIEFKELWDKYAAGPYAKWEYEAMCFYNSAHELSIVNKQRYGISNFSTMNPKGDIETYFKRGGVQIPIYNIKKIMGTVIGKIDTKNTITLLTEDGSVVDCRFSPDQYTKCKQRLVEVGEDGKKHCVEESWFKRGQKLVISGYRRNDGFAVKTYKNTPFHQCYLITNIYDDGQIDTVFERYDERIETAKVFVDDEKEEYSWNQ